MPAHRLRITKPTNSSSASHPYAHKCLPNLLPVGVNYSGPVNASTRYWTSVMDQAPSPISSPVNEATPDAAVGTEHLTGTAYFRGRKLRGRLVPMPVGYRGAVLQRTGKMVREPALEAPLPDAGDEDDIQDGQPDHDEQLYQDVEIFEDMASFDGLMIWGHESVPSSEEEEEAGSYIRGVEEWIKFSHALHEYDPKT